ncbi:MULTISPECIES: hypothetical protein [unclassified Enterococcus]|uniref:hypothetical protein n=1 Tax=unclassified Enterococcus TaxID=2608891 RepID=UPI0015517B4F|nr:MULTISPECIES: hypothetical protein [unclassified Enterococcus]MBS7578372.1 hypothetical protein [Enterococcus sp. MMGLQ5-2]MBS7585556.1 hypothetical protein [Enterococcus sp. MMGLQ5-1]NPD13415.1 hypothetical protein [Enterococcus sp. MMGLQ5-1]NPD38204.1 hypothetical protein [Enterococcus sp. MMGLQ5-2]
MKQLRFKIRLEQRKLAMNISNLYQFHTEALMHEIGEKDECAICQSYLTLKIKLKENSEMLNLINKYYINN